MNVLKYERFKKSMYYMELEVLVFNYNDSVEYAVQVVGIIDDDNSDIIFEEDFLDYDEAMECYEKKIVQVKELLS